MSTWIWMCVLMCRFQCAKIQLAHINANASVHSSGMASIVSTAATNNHFTQTMGQRSKEQFHSRSFYYIEKQYKSSQY